MNSSSSAAVVPSASAFYIGPPPSVGSLPLSILVYILLGLGGLLPIVFLLIVTTIIQCRKCTRRKKLNDLKYPHAISRAKNQERKSEPKTNVREITETLQVPEYGRFGRGKGDTSDDPYWIELSGGVSSASRGITVEPSGMRSARNSNVTFRDAGLLSSEDRYRPISAKYYHSQTDYQSTTPANVNINLSAANAGGAMAASKSMTLPMTSQILNAAAKSGGHSGPPPPPPPRSDSHKKSNRESSGSTRNIAADDLQRYYDSFKRASLTESAEKSMSADDSEMTIYENSDTLPSTRRSTSYQLDYDRYMIKPERGNSVLFTPDEMDVGAPVSGYPSARSSSERRAEYGGIGFAEARALGYFDKLHRDLEEEKRDGLEGGKLEKISQVVDVEEIIIQDGSRLYVTRF